MIKQYPLRELVMDSYASPAMRACQRAHHRLPRTIRNPPPQAVITAGAALGRGKIFSVNDLQSSEHCS